MSPWTLFSISSAHCNFFSTTTTCSAITVDKGMNKFPMLFEQDKCWKLELQFELLSFSFLLLFLSCASCKPTTKAVVASEVSLGFDFPILLIWHLKQLFPSEKCQNISYIII